MKAKIFPTPVKGAVLGMAFALLFSAGAQAQTNSTGNIAGDATAGDVVVITNPKTGFTRKHTVGETGHYKVKALPLGVYVVTVQHADGTVYLTQPTQVQIGRTSNIKEDTKE
ncbi:MAG: carboxypeptidase regulatory-like domain-containing protein [Arenimonas sp.]|nr:carboxypeptidase regulatory-like domain-containing protein [Arenimonas sp.]MBP8098712.1 carboxypeptidase regulatory-like domain-containing protein [Arenimonas sp.]